MEAGVYSWCWAERCVFFAAVCYCLCTADEPEIRTISQHMLLPVGNALVLQCIATGLPAPQVTWVHHRRNLSVVPHLVLSHSRETHKGGLVGQSNVTSAAVIAGDEGQYTCVASNVVSHHRKHVHVTIQCKSGRMRCPVYILYCHLPSINLFLPFGGKK